jgi:hypothetical protein
MANDRTIRASEPELNLLMLIRGAKLTPETVQGLVIKHLSEGLAANLARLAEPAPAPGTNTPATPRLGSPDALRDSYKQLRDAGYTTAEARKYRYKGKEQIQYLLDAKAAPPPAPEPEPAAKPKRKRKPAAPKVSTPEIIESKTIQVEVD